MFAKCNMEPSQRLEHKWLPKTAFDVDKKSAESPGLQACRVGHQSTNPPNLAKQRESNGEQANLALRQKLPQGELNKNNTELCFAVRSALYGEPASKEG